MKLKSIPRISRRRRLIPALGILTWCCAAPAVVADDVKILGYESLPNRSGGTLVRGVVFDLEVTADTPVNIDEIQFQIRGNNASTWDFTLYFREGSLADVVETTVNDEIVTLPAHRIAEEWVVIGEALAVPSPASSGKHPITLNMGPAEDGGLELSAGRYSFYFSSVGLEGSASSNGFRTTNPGAPIEGNPPFYEPLDVILENEDMQVLLGGSKGSLFGTTNPFSNLRAFGELEFTYTGGGEISPPDPLPDPVDLLVDSTDFTYTQDFNTLGNLTKTWINSGTLPGWHIYILDDASFSMDGRDLPATGGIQRRTYLNFGFTPDERALGATAGSSYLGIPEIESIPTGTTFGFVTLALKNNTTDVIDSLALSYDGLQFELGNSSGPQELRVAHATSDGAVPTDALAWVEVPEANFFSPRLSTPENPQPTGALIDPFQPQNRANRVAGDLTALDWQPGDTLWIRWRDTNAPGGDHGVLIDNVSLNLTQFLEWDAGIWAASGSGGSGNWADDAGGWQSDKVAVFNGDGGFITLDSVTAASGLRFMSGNFTLEDGSLELTGTVESANLIHVNEAADADIQSAVIAPSGFTKTGEGTLSLDGNTVIGGRSAIHAGVVFAHAASLDGDLDVRGRLDLTNDDGATLSGVISGSGEIDKRGVGELTLANASGFLGDFAIFDGAVRGPANGLPGGSIFNETTLVIDEPGTGTLDAMIDGVGDLVKTGAGTARLTRGNAYTGGNTVEQGTLLIDGDQSAAFDSPTTVASGAALGGIGALGGEVNAAAGSRIIPGGEGVIGTFTMFDGGTIEGGIEIDLDATSSDRIRVFLGSLDISSATLDLRLAAGATPEAPVYQIIEVDQDATLTGTFAEVLGMPAGYSLVYDLDGSVALVSDSAGGAGFGDWIAGFDGIDPGLSGPFADADGSGTANVLEFVLNGDPTDPSSNGLQAVWMDAASLENPLRFTIAAPQGTTFEAVAGGPQVAVIDGFNVRVEASATLSAFDIEVLHLSTTNAVPESGLPSLETSDWEYHTFGVNGAGDKAFIRVAVPE